MAPDLYNDWFIFLGTIGGIIAALWTVTKRLRKWCKRANGAIDEWPIAVQFFGENPSAAIHEILTDLGNATDIIELRQSIIARKLRIGIYVCDSVAGRCLFASDYLAEIFGLPQTAMLGLGWLAQISDQRLHGETWEFCWKRRIHYRDEYTVTNAQTGAAVRCRTEAYWLDSDGGRYVGYVEVIP